MIAPALNAGGAAPMFALRAWANIAGTGVVQFRAQGNCSAISYLGTGRYRVTFAQAMQDAHYAPDANGPPEAGAGFRYYAYPHSASQVNIDVLNASGAFADAPIISLKVTR